MIDSDDNQEERDAPQVAMLQETLLLAYADGCHAPLQFELISLLLVLAHDSK